MIIYNPYINAVIETIKVLNKNDDFEFIEDDVDTSNNKFVFKNQRIHTQAREFLDKEFGGVPTSTFNTRGDYMFHYEFIWHHAFSGWFDKKPEKLDNFVAYDYYKHYSSCFMGQDAKYGWPVYNVFDAVIDLYYVYYVYEINSNGEREAIAYEKFFYGKIEAGYYHIETSNFFPFRGNGFYGADLVDYGVKSGIITKRNILKHYKPSTVLEPKYFEKVCTFCF
jgi:hypothetical protein